MNHTTVFTLPDPSHGQSQGGNWTGDLTFYVKCQDSFGHESPGFYEVNVCVKEGPDRTAPVVRATNPENDAIVSFDSSEQNVEIVTNELAECRWDYGDKDYEFMGNSLECGDSIGAPSSLLGYSCSGVLPTVSAENVYYIRCMDQPWLSGAECESSSASVCQNKNMQSLVYVLRKPESKIVIDWIEPSEDFEVNTEMTTIDLRVRTSGGGDFHFCSYSFSGYETMIEFFETGTETNHGQPLNRPAGKHTIFVECRDETGDVAQGSTEFEIIYDDAVPQVARVWQSGGKLFVITTEDSECRYSTESCGFGWEDGEDMGSGEEHSISAIRGNNYFIKCGDEFGNVPSGCSISVRAL